LGRQGGADVGILGLGLVRTRGGVTWEVDARLRAPMPTCLRDMGVGDAVMPLDGVDHDQKISRHGGPKVLRQMEQI
jgi:hypothetical protein